MKYLVEIDSESAKGSKLMQYIEQLGADDAQIHILNEPPLSDEEMALPPTRRVSRAALEAWLKPEDNEQSFTGEEILEYIKKRREENSKAKER